MRLEGKVAFISGGARGMGATEARLFAQEGAKVAIADILEDEGRKTEAEINETGGEALFARLDVTKEEEWRQAVEATVARFGKLDVLVNNAGISGSDDPDIMSTDAWDKLMEINAKGVFLGIKYAVPEMRKVGGGSIVNISSISGLVGQDFVHMGYNASKGAVRILTKSAAVQYAKEGIRVNSVHPGFMPPMRTSIATADPEVPKQTLANVPANDAGKCSHGERRQAGGGRLRRVVPGFRRGFVHHRNRAGRGRRIYGPLALRHAQAHRARLLAETKAG